MTNAMRRLLAAAFCVGLAAELPALAAPILGQVDTFQGGTTLGWQEGGPSPNPPVVITGDGPAGIGDKYLQNVSSGGGGAGSKQIMFNVDSHWTGDFVTAGVTRITANLRNDGANDLHVRLGFQGSGGTQYVTDQFSLVAGGGWQSATFDLDAGSTNLVSGSDSLATVLGDVVQMRILSAASANYNGDSVAGALGVDNLTATAVPEPATMGVIGAGALLMLRRRRRGD